MRNSRVLCNARLQHVHRDPLIKTSPVSLYAVARGRACSSCLLLYASPVARPTVHRPPHTTAAPDELTKRERQVLASVMDASVSRGAFSVRFVHKRALKSPGREKG